MSDVTDLLNAIDQGKPQAANQLVPLLYDELRRLAAARLADEPPGQTLDATALVHEAYLRLVGDQAFQNRRHFFAAAAEAMRRVLVDRGLRCGGALSAAGKDNGLTWATSRRPTPMIACSPWTRPSRDWPTTTHWPLASSNCTTSPECRTTRSLPCSSVDQILADFPDPTAEDIRACLAFAADRERRLCVVPPE